jgi:iron(III) transport system substrate-binding protein
MKLHANKGKYMKKKLYISIIISLLTIFTSCTNDNVLDIEKLKEEDVLTICTSHKEELYGPLVEEFQARTGIYVDTIYGGTTELLADIRNNEDKHSCDLIFGGSIDILDANSDIFEAYSSSQSDFLIGFPILSEKKCTCFSKLPIVLIYNNKLVYESNIPDEWADVFNKEWKNELAFADPLVSSTSCISIEILSQILGIDERAVINNILSQTEDILEGSADVADKVASGDKLIGITLEETAKKKIALGANISIVYPNEGVVVVMDGIALVKDSIHKENAQKFIDFTVSADVQNFIVEKNYRRSVRTDVKEIANGFKIFTYDFNKASSNQNSIIEIWKELSR